MFLSTAALPDRGSGGPGRARRYRLTALMVRRLRPPSQTEVPFARWLLRNRCHPRSGRRWGRPPYRRVARPFRVAYRSGLPWWNQGRRGTFTGQCGQPLCPGETTTHPDGPQRPTVACAAERSSWTPRCFSRLGSLALRRGRNVAPPELSLPGPFVAAHCWPTLAAYPSVRRVRARISARARPRTGRIRSIDVGSIAPFMTEPTTPAAHA
jgi:hypothetical protein